MGRLILQRICKYLPPKARVRPWVTPICVALIVVICVHGVLAGRQKHSFYDYISNDNLPIGVQTVDGYQQVFYEFNKVRTYITSGSLNHIVPYSQGKYITWTEQNGVSTRLVLYNVLDRSTLIVAHAGHNEAPAASEGRVVWEKQREGIPQIYYFDGASTSQISSQHVSVRPAINKHSLAYAQQSSVGWEIVQRDLSSGAQDIVVRGGANDSWPFFDGDKLKTNYLEYARWKSRHAYLK